MKPSRTPVPVMVDVSLRMYPDLLDRIDRYRAAQPGNVSRQSLIRGMIEASLSLLEQADAITEPGRR